MKSTSQYEKRELEQQDQVNYQMYLTFRDIVRGK